MNDIIILAGGMGERLSHTVTDTQKTMAPVGDKPFLYYIVKRLIESGCKNIIFAVSYRREQIISFFGNNYNGVNILYSAEETPLGTGGAIKQALTLCTTPNVTVINGDTFFDVDINQLEAFHLQCGGDITLCAKKMHNFSRYGTLSFSENNQINGFYEKKQVSDGYINGGVYVIKKDCALLFSNTRFSFEKDVLEKLNFATYCMVSDGYFIDIGVPDDYFRAQTEIPVLFGETCFKAAFLDRDGVICKEKHHLHKTSDFEFTDRAPKAIEMLREHGYLIIVVTNQGGVAKGLYTENDVIELHKYMCSLLEGKTKLDAIYYSPFHPEATVEKYRKDSDMRKPKPGMINKAVTDFALKGINIDLKNSVIIGDTEKDILTGINAGVGTKILVRSGHTIPDENSSSADIITDSLYTAACRLALKNSTQTKGPSA